MAELGRAHLIGRIKSSVACSSRETTRIWLSPVDPDTYKVHKAVVWSQSGFFKKAENFPIGKEMMKSVIGLPTDEPSVVELLIDFFYEGDYKPQHLIDSKGQVTLSQDVQKYSHYHYDFPHSCGISCGGGNVCEHHICGERSCKKDCRNFICKMCTGVQDHEDPAVLLLHAKMAAIADKYDIPGLAMVARKKFAYYCVKFWDHKMFLDAAECGLSFSRSDADNGLSDVLCKKIVAHTALLEQPRIKAAMDKNSGLAFQVVKQQARELSRLRAGAS